MFACHIGVCLVSGFPHVWLIPKVSQHTYSHVPIALKIATFMVAAVFLWLAQVLSSVEAVLISR